MKCIQHLDDAEHSRCIKGCCACRVVPSEGQCTDLIVKTGSKLQCFQKSTFETKKNILFKSADAVHGCDGRFKMDLHCAPLHKTVI